jgi:hypothetical protein
MTQLINYSFYAFITFLILSTVFGSIEQRITARNNKKNKLLTMAHKKINAMGKFIAGDAQLIMSPISQRICLLKIQKSLLDIYKLRPSKATMAEIKALKQRLNKLPVTNAELYQRFPIEQLDTKNNHHVKNINRLIAIFKQAYSANLINRNSYLNEIKSLRHLAFQLKVESSIEKANAAIENEKYSLALIHYNGILTLLESVNEQNAYTQKLRNRINISIKQTKELLDALLTDTRAYENIQSDSSDKYHQQGAIDLDNTDELFSDKKRYF